MVVAIVAHVPLRMEAMAAVTAPHVQHPAAGMAAVAIVLPVPRLVGAMEAAATALHVRLQVAAVGIQAAEIAEVGHRVAEAIPAVAVTPTEAGLIDKK
jgi:hypothetical protein